MRTSPSAGALLISVALTCGCTKRQAGIGVGVGLGIAVSGAVVAGSGSGPSAMGNAFIGIGLAGLGGTVVLGSLLGMAVGPSAWGSKPAARIDVEATAQAAARRRAEARELTKRAIEFARDDRCKTVSLLHAKVRTLDSKVHATVFLADVGITRCLAPAPSVHPTPAPEPSRINHIQP